MTVVARVVWERKTTMLVQGESLEKIREAAEQTADDGDMDDLGWTIPEGWEVRGVYLVGEAEAKLVRQGVNRKGKIVPREDIQDA